MGAQLAAGGVGDAAPELAAALKDLEGARRRAADLEAGSAESSRELERLRDTTTKQRLRNKAGGFIQNNHSIDVESPPPPPPPPLICILIRNWDSTDVESPPSPPPPPPLVCILI